MILKRHCLKNIIQESDLKKKCISNPNTCLGVLRCLKKNQYTTTGLISALDTIRDPGNLGTILRLCDWFGVKQILCSKETDIYNPKVVKLLGSIGRVNVNYIDLEHFIAESNLPVLVL
jgi:TrmH family RNA methyltransferase